MAFLFPTLSKIVKTMVIVAVLNWSSMESTAKSAQKETLGGLALLLLGFVGLAVFLNSDVKWIYYPAQNVCVLHVLAFASLRRRSNLDLNFNLTGKTLRKLRWKAHEELADVIEFNS